MKNELCGITMKETLRTMGQDHRRSVDTVFCQISHAAIRKRMEEGRHAGKSGWELTPPNLLADLAVRNLVEKKNPEGNDRLDAAIFLLMLDAIGAPRDVIERSLRVSVALRKTSPHSTCPDTDLENVWSPIFYDREPRVSSWRKIAEYQTGKDWVHSWILVKLTTTVDCVPVHSARWSVGTQRFLLPSGAVCFPEVWMGIPA